MPHVLVLVAIALTVLVTSFISGILGMAGGMILMGVLVMLMPVPVAMMLHGITQMAANGWRAWLWRRAIDWRVFRGTCLGALAVLAVFSALQLAGSRPVVYLILGITPFISYLVPASLKLNVDRRGHAFLCGVVATKAASQTLSHLVKIVYFGVLLSSARGVGDRGVLPRQWVVGVRGALMLRV